MTEQKLKRLLEQVAGNGSDKSEVAQGETYTNYTR